MSYLAALQKYDGAHADTAHRSASIAMLADSDRDEIGDLLRALKAMSGNLDLSSRTEDVDVIAVIDGIVFQTIILALNAAVEIKQLIGESVRTVEEGRVLAGQAGRTMDGVTQQNAALVEQAAAAADALQQQAASLADAVSIFKLHAVPGVAAPARRLSLT